MLTALRALVHRYASARHLREAVYLASDRQIQEEIGLQMRHLSGRAVRDGWAPRTTAAVLASIWVAGQAKRLEPERRLRVAEIIMEQERSGLDALRWLENYHEGRINLVGVDPQLLRFNVAKGTIEAWLAEGVAVDPRVSRIFVAMAAWSLSDMSGSEIEARLNPLLDDLGR